MGFTMTLASLVRNRKTSIVTRLSLIFRTLVRLVHIFGEAQRWPALVAANQTFPFIAPSNLENEMNGRRTRFSGSSRIDGFIQSARTARHVSDVGHRLAALRRGGKPQRIVRNSRPPSTLLTTGATPPSKTYGLRCS